MPDLGHSILNGFMAGLSGPLGIVLGFFFGFVLGAAAMKAYSQW